MPTLQVREVDSSSSVHFRNKLLATLPDDDQQRLASSFVCAPFPLKKVLHKQGEPIRDIYFPGGGACSLVKVMHDGGTGEIATIGNEGAIGIGAYFGDPQSPGDAFVQVADGDGYKMSVETFTIEMERRGAFYDRLTRYSQAFLTQVMQTTACNGLHSAEQRCCRWLLMTRDRVGKNDLKLTHEFLAMMLAVRRPTVTLVMNDLQQAGLVATRRGFISIADAAGLEQASCECYRSVRDNFHRLLPEMAGPTG